MRMNYRLIAALALAGLAAAQSPQVERGVASRRAAAAAGPGKKYLEAYATPDPTGPTIHCDGPGFDCVVETKLLETARVTPSHDETLQRATAEINAILEETARNAPPGKALCLYRSAGGPLLIWREAAAPPRSPRAVESLAAREASSRVTDPRAIAGLLGIQGARKAAGGDKTFKAELVWDDSIKHYFWSCTKPGTDCVIHASLASATARTVFDATLQSATEKINAVLSNAAAKAPKGSLRLCLLFLPEGPILAWTSSEPPATGARTISSESPEFGQRARETLALR